MKLRILVAAIIFIGSYLPLSMILLVQDYDGTKGVITKETIHLPLQHPQLSMGLFLVCFVSFLIALSALRVVNPKHEIKIIEVRHVPADLMNYVLPYVVSFMSLDFSEPNKFMGFLIFLSWIFLVTYKSGQIILNPMLTVLNWRLYEISYTFAGSSKVYHDCTLTNGKIEANGRYKKTNIQDIIIIKDPGQ